MRGLLANSFKSFVIRGSGEVPSEIVLEFAWRDLR
jgi:hypothetical protein